MDGPDQVGEIDADNITNLLLLLHVPYSCSQLIRASEHVWFQKLATPNLRQTVAPKESVATKIEAILVARFGTKINQ
jgi:hypothetical protein